MNQRTYATKKNGSNSSVKQTLSSKTGAQPIFSPHDALLQLQHQFGNEAVQRLFESGSIQAKLRIGEPNDVYEQEADQVAEKIVRMPEDSAISGQRSAIGREDMIQLKPS